MSEHLLSPLHTDPASGLAYRTQARPPAQASRLLVLLHGVGGHEQQLAGLLPLLPPDWLLVLARGPLQLGPQQFAWFEVQFGSDGPRIHAAQAEHSRQQLVSLLANLQFQFGVVPEHCTVAGFSQGGIMSASVALTSPASLGRFAVLCGRILPEIAPILAEKSSLALLDGYLCHGEHDDKLPVSWAERATAWLTELGVPHTLQRYPAAHQLTAAMAQDFASWLARR